MRSELENLTADETTFRYCHRLEDNYSDYGIDAALISQRKILRMGNQYLAHFRYTNGRGMADWIFGYFVSSPLADGEIVAGTFVESGENRLVAGLLNNLGFKPDTATGGVVFAA